MLIDTHSHLNFDAFKNDFDEVARRALKNNVWLINVGAGFDSSRKAIEIAEKYPEGVYATVGLHPIYSEQGLSAGGLTPRKLEWGLPPLRMLAKHKKVIAIGEIGLDYKSEYVSFKEKQKEVFLEQMNLAKELNLPIIFHCRFAHQDLIKILNRIDRGPSSAFCRGRASVQGVVHCFTGTLEQVKQYLDMGLYIGFNGIIFKLDLDEIIRKIPLDKILIETDCPFLTPPDFAEKRNNPLGVKQVAEYIADIKKNSFEEVADTTTQNAKDLFKI